MTSAQIEIQLIAIVVAVACALPGVFLVLRQMAMMSDAISHTVLLGIVIAFFIVGDLESPWLILGATLTGVLTVSLVELLNNTKLVKQDAAIGLVFPALFSLAVILISRYAGHVHLDTDAVLLGELAFAPFDRLTWIDMPRGLAVMGIILLLNLLFITLLYKELKLATFDPGLAAALGLSPVWVHYGLMTMVSITAVGAFDSVGSVLVVALMIAPPATAYLLTDDLPHMIGWSIVVGIGSAIGGYWLARWLDANIAGSMATMSGLIFVAGLLFAPERGMVAILRRRVRHKWEFAQTSLAIHLLQHENTPAHATECRVDHLHYHLNWEPNFAVAVVSKAAKRGLIERNQGDLALTDVGRTLARETMVN